MSAIAIETRRVEVDGRPFVHDEAGEGGRPLVLVHGFTGSRRDFAPVLPDLAARGRTLAPALRGHADAWHAGPEPGAYELDRLADDLVAWLDALGIERCDLLGHSMGGFVVERVVLAHPERVASLALMDTAGRAMDWMDARAFEVGARIAVEQGMEKLHEILRGRAAADPTRTVADRRLEADWGAERYWDWRRERFAGVDPHAVAPITRQLVEHPDLLERLGAVRCPTLVLVGEHDTPFLAPARELARAIPGARLEILPDAGHQPQVENPTAWLQALTPHLQTQGPGSIANFSADEDPHRMEIATERVEIPVPGGGTMGGYLARPQAGGPHPAVVVYMEIFGVNDHIRDVTGRVAREGYVALAPDFFHRTAPGIELGYDDAGMERGLSLLHRLVAEEMEADARAAVSWLRDRGDTTDHVACMGFCVGGHMAYLSACATDVDAAVSFYGGGIAAPKGPWGGPSTLSRTPEARGPILCLFGRDDALIPPDQVEAIRGALDAAGPAHEVVVYDGCGHGFFCDQRDAYDADAARDAWRRTKDWLARHLG